ncbi:MAG: ABC transporter permease [Acidobacteria bacterium]|nr:MAG: ABC transporter permease [Acidobacteriota bacterium]
MPHLFRDLRYACRGLLCAPLFTMVAVVSIALGIGANTAIFTLVDQVLLRQLPVAQPEELVLLTQRGPHHGNNRGGNATSFPMYEDFREAFVDPSLVQSLPRVSLPYDALPAANPLFSGMFCRYAMSLNVGFGGQTDRVAGELVSGTYFPVLGVGAAVGRVIAPEDDRVRGGHPVAVLSYEYWRTRFGADTGVIGKTIVVNNYPLTIIGVSQAGFDGVDIGYAPGVRVPMMMKARMTPTWDDLDNRRSRWANVFGRLKPGVTAADAKAALQPYFHGVRSMEVQEAPFRTTSAETREQFLSGTIDLLPAAQGRSPLRIQLRQPLWLLMGTVVGVLLIACANVASLLIARASSRQKEFAVRLALGAGRGRIVSQLLAESVLLAGIGGVLGLVVARWTSGFLLGFIPTGETPHVISGSLDWRILAFNFALALAAGVLFGLVPALRSTKPSLAPTLKDQVGTVVGGGSGVRLRKTLVIAQVMLSVLLLIGAGLFIRSLRNLHLTDLGMRADSLLAFNIDPSIGGYSSVRTQQFYQQFLDRMKTSAGVSGVAFAAVGVLEGNEWDSTMTIEGYEAKPGENMNPYCNAVSPGYFRTMGVPFIAGRDFDQRDAVVMPLDPKLQGPPSTFRVAIVNESFAKYYYGDASPIGRRIGFGGDPGTATPIEIIGVVKDAKYTGVRDDIPRQVFFAYQQMDAAGSAAVYIRSAQDPAAALAAARRTLREMDSNIPIYNFRTLARQIERSLLTERIVATLSSAFGVLATLLAVIGLYGLMAYTASRRTREIGLRMALGAVSGDVVWLVMREVIVLVGVGVTLGLAAAWGLSRLIGNQLYGVSPNDPATMVAVACGLTIIALVAGYIPACRAARVNPVTALRYE